MIILNFKHSCDIRIADIPNGQTFWGTFSSCTGPFYKKDNTHLYLLTESPISWTRTDRLDLRIVSDYRPIDIEIIVKEIT